MSREKYKDQYTVYYFTIDDSGCIFHDYNDQFSTCNSRFPTYTTSSIKILLASFSLRLRLYPETDIEIGSPNGAMNSTLIGSPGIQPISMSLINISSFSKECMIPFCPVFSSLNLFILISVVSSITLQTSNKDLYKWNIVFTLTIPIRN